ncbi:MAG: DUF2510 domain-containing protein [Coriobacteriia bacterium]|nr:DUF2510 domain-containing protein [Coriobacteriia bacterium]
MAENQTPAGWYADPAGDQTKLRYWDGQQWTEQLTDAGVPEASSYASQTTVPTYEASSEIPAPSYAAMPQQQAPYDYQQAPGAPAGNTVATAGKDPKAFAIAGLICAIVGLPITFFVMILLGLILGIIGVVFGIRGRKSSMSAVGTASLVVGIITVVLSCAAWGINFFAIL